jgi:predicted outer membrane repeat protein
VALVAAGLSVPAGAAQAQTLFDIGCDESSDTDEGWLIDAINAANNESTHPGPDVIRLTPGCTYAPTTHATTYPYAKLPPIESTITVLGQNATLDGGGVFGGPYNLLWVTADGSLSLQDLTVTNNYAYVLSLGAVHNLGTLALDGTTFSYDGNGAVYSGGLLTVQDSHFAYNSVDKEYGGAIQAWGSLIVDNSDFTGNQVTGDYADYRVRDDGGAIYLGDDSGGFISDSSFSNNRAYDSIGGAIASRGTLAVTRSTFTQNRSYNGGGAIMAAQGAPLTVTDSFFDRNESGVGGGAIDTQSSTSISNSTFYANAAGRGGAVSQEFSAALSIDASTFASNTATQGAAIDQDTTTGHTTNSLFDGQTTACFGIQAGEGNVVDAYDASCPGNFQVGDPKLQAPALNGGTTKTMRLGSGSFAAEHISTTCPARDQRGYARPSGAKCDAGAYEDQAPTVPGTPTVTAGGNPSNTGTLTLGWAASTDADDTVSYRVLHKDANDAAFSVLTTTTATSASFTAPEGTWTYVVEARDGNHAYDSGWSSDVVVDKTRPSTPTVSADRAPDYGPATGTSWYQDAVTVTTTSNGDPALADTSAGSGVASVTAPATYSTSGTTTYTGTATDGAGNVSLPASLTVSVDAESPTVGFSTCPATVLLKHTATASWTASDPSSGLATPASGSFTLDTATIGHKSVSTTASDNVGHSTTATCAYDVVFDFTGFFTPLANPPDVVKASAGQNLSIAFSLAGNQGLGVLAPGYPLSAATACNAFGAQTSGTPTSAVKPGLTFSSGSGGRYVYVWKTSSTWRGTCRQLVVKLSDGTYHRANISFG